MFCWQYQQKHGYVNYVTWCEHWASWKLIHLACTVCTKWYRSNAMSRCAGRCCVLFSFARWQHLPAQTDIATIVCRRKITRSNQKIRLRQSMRIHSGNVVAKFHSDPISNDGASGFLAKWHHGRHLKSHIRNPTPSIDAYSLKEHSCQMSSPSDLKWQTDPWAVLKVVTLRRTWRIRRKEDDE